MVNMPIHIYNKSKYKRSTIIMSFQQRYHLISLIWNSPSQGHVNLAIDYAFA